MKSAQLAESESCGLSVNGGWQRNISVSMRRIKRRKCNGVQPMSMANEMAYFCQAGWLYGESWRKSLAAGPIKAGGGILL
jgi:hypothetical protein